MESDLSVNCATLVSSAAHSSWGLVSSSDEPNSSLIKGERSMMAGNEQQVQFSGCYFSPNGFLLAAGQCFRLFYGYVLY